MVIFYSYVSLPVGKHPFSYGFPIVFQLLNQPTAHLSLLFPCLQERHAIQSETSGSGSGVAAKHDGKP